MPFDLVTTYTQMELGQDVLYSGVSKTGNKSALGAQAARKQSVKSRLATIYRQNGLKGLYIGVMPRMLRVVPACAIMISIFEYSKSFFFHYNLGLQQTGRW